MSLDENVNDLAHVVHAHFNWMKDNPSWAKEYATIMSLLDSVEQLRALVVAKDLLLSEWLGEEKAQSEIERLRKDQEAMLAVQAQQASYLRDKNAEIERLRAQLALAKGDDR
jgi:hypothetical protein